MEVAGMDDLQTFFFVQFFRSAKETQTTGFFSLRLPCTNKAEGQMPEIPRDISHLEATASINICHIPLLPILSASAVSVMNRDSIVRGFFFLKMHKKEIVKGTFSFYLL